MRKVRLVVALAAVTLAATLLPPATAGATGSQFTETFDSSTWYTRWNLLAKPGNTEVVTNLVDGSFLQVAIPSGSNDGTSFFYNTGAAESVRLRYRIRFSPNWVPMTSQSGKIPGFGLPNRTAGNVCIEACGGKPVIGPYYSARNSFAQGNLAGTYLYRPKCTGDTEQETGKNHDWGFQFTNGVWYSIDQTITMNTPDQPNGTEYVKVNGVLVWSATDLCLRKSADVPVGNVWMDFFYGGDVDHANPSPVTQWINVDDVIVNY